MTKLNYKYLPGNLLLLAALSLVSCIRKDDEPKTSTAQSTPSVQSSPQPAASSAPTTTTQSLPAIAVTDGETPGTKVEVQELKRGGNAVMLKIAIVNDSEKPLTFGYNFGDEANHIKDFNSIGGVTLVDSIGKKKYFVVRDAENACVCSSNLKDIAPRSRANVWAKFPAPPDEVQKISVIIPHFTPLDDVPITH